MSIRSKIPKSHATWKAGQGRLIKTTPCPAGDNVTQVDTVARGNVVLAYEEVRAAGGADMRLALHAIRPHPAPENE